MRACHYASVPAGGRGLASRHKDQVKIVGQDDDLKGGNLSYFLESQVTSARDRVSRLRAPRSPIPPTGTRPCLLPIELQL